MCMQASLLGALTTFALLPVVIWRHGHSSELRRTFFISAAIQTPAACARGFDYELSCRASKGFMVQKSFTVGAFATHHV